MDYMLSQQLEESKVASPLLDVAARFGVQVQEINPAVENIGEHWLQAGQQQFPLHMYGRVEERINQSARMVELQCENDFLRKRIAILEGQRRAADEEQVIELREVTKEEAKVEIVELFDSGETLYYSDISDRLRIDLELVVEICRELQAEGEIAVDDDAV